MLLNGNSCVQLHNPFQCFNEKHPLLMEHCCCRQMNVIRVNRDVDAIAVTQLDYLSFIEFTDLFGVKEVMHISFNLQHVAQLKFMCISRLHGRCTILNIVKHLNSSIWYFNFHLIRTWPRYHHPSPRYLLFPPPFTCSFCSNLMYMFFSFTCFLLHIKYS
jgi:hypothetical protein